MNKHSVQFRALALDAMRPYDGIDYALLLSGGVDSATMLAAALVRGHKPHCYTFRLSGYESSDFKVSRSMCETFGLQFTPVIVPQDVDTLIADIKRVMKVIQTAQKTHVQCCHPMLYAADTVLPKRKAIWASTLDFLFGSSRKAQVALHTSGHRAFTEARIKALNDLNLSDRSIERVFSAKNVQLSDPFNFKSLIDFMLGLTFDQMHKPKQKIIAVRAFPEFWAQGSWYRLHDSYQVNSRIREFHDVLLSHPINKRGHRAIVGLYNELLRDLSC